MNDHPAVSLTERAARAAALLRSQPNDRSGRRNRCIVLLYLLAFPGVSARSVIKHTGLSAHQVHYALRSLTTEQLITHKTGDDRRYKLCSLTPSGATYATDTILPKVGLAPVGLAAPRIPHRTYRNVVHPTLLDRVSYLGYRRAMRKSGIIVNLDRFELSLLLFLGNHSSLEATWYQSELYPTTPTRRVKAKHQETDTDTVSRYNVRGRFGGAVRHLCDLGLVQRWQNPESKKTAWMFQKLPALDTLYERIHESLRQKT